MDVIAPNSSPELILKAVELLHVHTLAYHQFLVLKLTQIVLLGTMAQDLRSQDIKNPIDVAEVSSMHVKTCR